MGYSVVQCNASSQFFSSQSVNIVCQKCSAKDCVASGDIVYLSNVSAKDVEVRWITFICQTCPQKTRRDIVYLSNVSAKDVAIEETWRLIGSVLAQAAGRLSNAAVR